MEDAVSPVVFPKKTRILSQIKWADLGKKHSKKIKLTKRDKIVSDACFLKSEDRPYHTAVVYSTDLYAFSFIIRAKGGTSDYVLDRNGRFQLQYLAEPLKPHYWGYICLDQDKEGYGQIRDVFPDSLLTKIENSAITYVVNPLHKGYRKIFAIKSRKLLDECKFYTANEKIVSHEAKKGFGKSLWDFPSLDKILLEKCRDKVLKHIQMRLDKKKDPLAFAQKEYGRQVA